MNLTEPLSPFDSDSESESESAPKHFAPDEVERRVIQYLERLTALQAAQNSIPHQCPNCSGAGVVTE